MNIRRAEPKDIDVIHSELQRHIASCINYFPQSEKSAVAQTILSSFHSTAPMVVLVSENEKKITGIAHAIVSRYPWANKLQAMIWLVYVSPEHRHGMTFPRLLAAVEKWCEEKKADQISFSIATGNNDEQLADCMEKRGWFRDGIGLVKRL